MPGRREVLATEQVYHLFNRGVALQPTFFTVFDYRRFLNTLNFYRFYPHSIRLFQFLELSQKRKREYLKNISQKEGELINIFCFCLMPNHYHLLVRQNKDKGISKFMSQLQNSFTKYFNAKRKRVGPIFQGHFKAVGVETDEQLIHLSRYIHLNPYSSYVVKSIKDLKTYLWSSLPDYLGKYHHSFLKKKFVLDLFENQKDFRRFTFNQAEYQRELEGIKHLIWDD